MEGFLSGIEQSWLGVAARSSTWLYPLANVAHVVGAALLFGSIATYDIRVLRGATAEELAATGRVALPLAALGILIAATAGSVLFSAEASAAGRNAVFLFKLSIIALALANVAAYHARFRGDWRKAAPSRLARFHAALSLAAWLIVLCAGRLIAYV